MITPGAYLKSRRCAAGLSLGEVAAQISTEPRWSALVRASWLERMEADIEPLSLVTIVALGTVFPIDIAVLYELERNRLGIEAATTPVCIICGATQRDGCGYSSAPFCAWTAQPAPVGAAS